MSGLNLVLFDADGVLLDSLKPHLRICEDKRREYGLDLKIPSPGEFKQLARRGTRISPMKYFFLAVGFPEDLAEKANRQYQEVFMRDYAPSPFPGVDWTLNALRERGLQLGIVTSNVRANVVQALGASVRHFHPDCIFTKDDTSSLSKDQAISAAMLRIHAKSAETMYVGDQPADWEAAKAAGVDFLGVAYGWGISPEDKGFPIVNEVAEIYRFISERAGTATIASKAHRGDRDRPPN